MNRKKHYRAGFTLTEILMATGILGVGLTMVASVFPVAVDQSRRSRDATMAAMCARSMAAYMRANRSKVLEWCRAQAKSKTTVMTSSAVPYAIRMYNPVSFLYDSVTDKGGRNKPLRKYNPEVTDYGLWAQGNYTPMMFATPMDSRGYGPWRITIVLFKARGEEPAYIRAATTGMKTWKDSNSGTIDQYAPGAYLRGNPGEYLLDWNPTKATSYRGEAYMVDRVIPNRTSAPSDSVYLAPVPMKEVSRRSYFCTADDEIVNTSATGTPGWVSLPGSIAAYHTILGD